MVPGTFAADRTPLSPQLGVRLNQLTDGTENCNYGAQNRFQRQNYLPQYYFNSRVSNPNKSI